MLNKGRFLTSHAAKASGSTSSYSEVATPGAICLVTGLTITTVVAAQALPTQVVAGVTFGTAVAQTTETAALELKHLTESAWFKIDVAHRRHTALMEDTRQSFSQLKTWPEADLDALSSTDFEDLVVFAADVFEFLQQEYAVLVAAYGEGRLLTLGGAALWTIVRAYRAIITARRLK